MTFRRSTTPRRPQVGKKPLRPNASILDFFQKVDKPEDSLFLGPEPVIAEKSSGADAHHRKCFGEVDSPTLNKRCRINESADFSAGFKNEPLHTSPPPPPPANKSTKLKRPMPFTFDDDSDSDQDQNHVKFNASESTLELKPPDSRKAFDMVPKFSASAFAIVGPKVGQQSNSNANAARMTTTCPQEPKKELTASHGGAESEFGHLTDQDFLQGDELCGWNLIKEEARQEGRESGDVSDFAETFADNPFGEDEAGRCPICSCILADVSYDDATKHVNSCLDSNPVPISKSQKLQEAKGEQDVQIAHGDKRSMLAAIPRPGQPIPFSLMEQQSEPKSAISQLMSNNEERSAWSSAAAAEVAAKNKAAGLRTCPFYKIMPGFSICVDAFRYGAVQGCNAYFLSHFHTDHYAGLTSRWTHGPIYCSKVTGSLVKAQLNVADRWVVELDFEKEYVIPGTDGAKVTMIPANHCPGSSMFLFEKVMHQWRNKTLKRILHCGDFRACPAHVQHPLLRPELRDSVSGKLIKKQKIDICYLDTTYLSPRYSFPEQSDVFQACADLCANLSPDPRSGNDVWEVGGNKSDQMITRFFQAQPRADAPQPEPDSRLVNEPRVLVVCGTYSIGKERLCVAIAKAMHSKIYAPYSKQMICSHLDDDELTSLLTNNPLEAQVHLAMLRNITIETLEKCLETYKPHFSRIIGLHPSGWTFKPKDTQNSMTTNTPPTAVPTAQILHNERWRPRFGPADFEPRKGSTKEVLCFGVPYSEHSSFRELTLFLMSLQIDKVVPTVNLSTEATRNRMRAWIDKWASERRRYGLVTPLVKGRDDVDGCERALWDGVSNIGGVVWW